MALSRNSYYRGFDWFIQTGVLILLVVAPFEDKGRFFYVLGQGLALIGLVGRCGMDMDLRYAMKILAVYGAALLAVVLTAWGYAIHLEDPAHFGLAMSAFFKEYAVILLATVVLLTHSQSEVYARLTAHPRILAIILAMVAFWFLVVLASLTSYDPPESLRVIRKELGPYFLLFILTIETIRTWARLRRLLVLTFTVGALTCLASCCAYLLYQYAQYYEWSALYLWLADKDAGFWVRTHPGLTDIAVQAQFPFEHPNRLGSFGVIVCMLGPVVFMAVSGRKTRAWVVAGALCAFVAVFLSGTRGAVVAMLIGLALFVLLADWRLIFPMIILLALGYGLAPAAQKERVAKIVDPAEWSVSRGNLARRFHLALFSLEMIQDHPWMGIGYGSRVFEDQYPVYRDRVAETYGEDFGAEAIMRDPESKTHAHNNFLQIAASSGLPALVAFVVFATLLAVGFLRRYQVPLPDRPSFRGMAAAMFALWMSILLYGMTNYSLRGGIGMYIWLILGASVSFIQLSAHPAVAQQRPVKSR